MINRFSTVMDEVKGIKIRMDKVERCIDNHTEKVKRLDEEHTSMMNAIDFFDSTIKEHRTNISRLERGIINPERMEFWNMLTDKSRSYYQAFHFAQEKTSCKHFKISAPKWRLCLM